MGTPNSSESSFSDSPPGSIAPGPRDAPAGASEAKAGEVPLGT